MNILVVDDHPLVRRGIIDILSMNQAWNDIYETDNIEETIKIVKTHQINIILVDLHLGKENGFDLIERVRKTNQQVKYVVLTSSFNYMDFKQAQVLEVDGYILKDSFIEDIIYALNVVNRGEKYYSPQLRGNSVNGFEPKELLTLTDREKEVFTHMSKGLSNTQISDLLFISEGTTKKHISNILSKLNLNNRLEVVIYAKKLYGN
jgi:two-component system nitrate/nitrite response regulator NarL